MEVIFKLRRFAKRLGLLRATGFCLRTNPRQGGGGLVEFRLEERDLLVRFFKLPLGSAEIGRGFCHQLLSIACSRSHRQQLSLHALRLLLKFVATG